MQPSNSIVPETRWGKSRAGMWEIRWTERGPDGRARTRSYSCSTSDFEAAQIVRRGWLNAQRAAQSETLVALSDVLDAYERAKGSKSQAWALLPVRRHFVGFVASDVTTAQVDAYMTARSRAVAPGTIRREAGALLAALNWAAHPKRQLIPASVVPGVDLPPEGAPRMNYLCASEAKRMFDVAAAEATDTTKPFRERRLGFFVCIALETAAREAAIRGLTWDRADLGVGLIDFRDPGLAVSRKRRVPVPVSKVLAPVLAAAHDARGLHGSPFVLGHSGAVRKSFVRFCARHGFADVTIHDLRRTWASLRVQWGVDIAAVAGVLGDTVETTEKHYAHLSPGYLRGAVDARPGKD